MRYSFLYLTCLLIFSHYVQANNNIDSLESRFENSNELNKLDISITLSKAYWNISPHKGMFYANEAIKLAENQNNQSKKAKALLYGGVNAWFMGDYDVAIEYYHKSLSIAKKIHNVRLSAYNLNNLGMVNTHLKNYKKALNNYSEASLIIKKLGDEIEYAKVINNIAGLNIILGNYDEALKNQLSIVDKIQNSDEQTFLIWILNDIGTIYSKKGDYELALKYFFKSLKISNETDDSVGKTKILNGIGTIYLKKKEYKKANEYFYIGLHYAKNTNTKDNIKKSYKNLSEYYYEIKNYKKSLDYYKLYKQISDSIIDENKTKKIVEMQTKYETESKEKENSLLRKSNKIKSLALEKQTNLRNFFIVLLTLAILLIILVYSRFAVKRKINKTLNKKNSLISKQKNEIQTHADELIIANKTKDKFFSIIAHDLKAPFNIILGFSDFLKENFDKIDVEKQKQYLDFINQSGHNTFKLLENLLIWSRSQSGVIDFKPANQNLYLLTNNTIQLLNKSAENKSISLNNKVPHKISVFADEPMLSTIIRNLVSNAIKFTPKGGSITIDAREIKKQNKQNFTEITIKDSGVGIPFEKQSQLFKISGNVSTKGTEKEEGTGLGLILCKEFVEKHNGKIYVESEVGKGSKFIFTLQMV